MPAFDANLMFRTTANLTVSESSSGIKIRKTSIRGMAVRVVVPTAFADGDTIMGKVYESDDNSSFNLISQSAVKSGYNTAPGDFFVPFVSKKKYVKLELVVTSTTAANINFGAVKAGLVFNVGFDWSRPEMVAA